MRGGLPFFCGDDKATAKGGAKERNRDFGVESGGREGETADERLLGVAGAGGRKEKGSDFLFEGEKGIICY